MKLKDLADRMFRYFVFITWCFPQTFLGLLLFAIFKGLIDRKAEVKEGPGFTIVIKSKKYPGGISLGLFIFVCDYGRGEEDPAQQRMLWHEYGHTIQGFMSGWWYLLGTGVPSMGMNLLRKIGLFKNTDYYDFYIEKWADDLGNVER